MAPLRFLKTSLISIVAAFMITNAVNAEEWYVEKTIYLEKGTIPDPKIIARTHDDGFIIAGKSLGQGWAVETDSQGNLKWKFLHDDETSTTRQKGDYASVAVMQDDSSFLCGTQPDNKKVSGLLTHLDKNGKILNDQILYPHNDKEEFRVNRILACGALNNGLDVVGLTTKFTPNKAAESSTAYTPEYFYWISSFDKNGKLKWEKLIPVHSKIVGAGADISPLQPASDGGFVFIAINNLAAEILHISSNGDVITKNIFDGITKVVLPVNPTKDMQLFAIDGKSFNRIQLNSKLQESNRNSNKTPDINYLHVAYYLPDNSLILFGSGTSKPSYARIVKLDSALNQQQIIDVSAQKDSYWVNAALPLEKNGAFVAVRSAMKPINQSDALNEDKLKEARLGVALDFIKTK